MPCFDYDSLVSVCCWPTEGNDGLSLGKKSWLLFLSMRFGQKTMFAKLVTLLLTSSSKPQPL